MNDNVSQCTFSYHYLTFPSSKDFLVLCCTVNTSSQITELDCCVIPVIFGPCVTLYVTQYSDQLVLLAQTSYSLSTK